MLSTKRESKKALQEEPAVEDDNKEIANMEEVDNGNSIIEGLDGNSAQSLCYNTVIHLHLLIFF